jgi:DNA-binding NarL/FixJ family response regulator
MIRVLIADDHPVVRDGLAAMLSTQPDFDVVGTAATGREAVAQAQALQPDVVLLDLEMPELDGVEALRQMAARTPQARALVFTAFDTDERIVAAVQAGARGYLLKGAPRDELFNAIRVVSQGGSLLQPIVASKLIQRISQPPADPPVDPLTGRELEVLTLLAQGKANKEIAAALHISERTVKFHVSAIFNRLGAGNRTEAVRFAVQRGLIQL